MRRHLREFVRIQIFPGREMPTPTSRQYFPTKKDIYNHMYRAMVKSRFSNCDQTNAEEKVKEWQMQTPNDKVFFRKYSDICDAKFENDVVSNSSNREDLDDEDIRVTSPLSYQKFLFVHQTTWQRRLLSNGNDVCLLDAMYKTTRCALPLSFLAVKTNVDYQVVASFVLQDESTDSIKDDRSFAGHQRLEQTTLTGNHHSLWLIFVRRKSTLLRRHFQVPPNSVFSIYNVLCMCSTLKGNRYITLMLTLLFFFCLWQIITNLKQRKLIFITSKFTYNTYFVWCVYT